MIETVITMRLIDADKALDSLEYERWYHINDDGKLIEGSRNDLISFVTYNSAKRSITEQPIVDAAPVVHGHWVSLCGEHILPDANGKVGPEGCICSRCEEYLGGSGEYIVNGKFCPSCGAKMDEEDGERNEHYDNN